MNASVQKVRPGPHPQEKGVLLIVALHLVFLPWAFGTMHIWAQLVSLGLASLGFVLAIMPRVYTPEQGGGSEGFRMEMWQRLLRFPLFWFGLGLLALLLVQAFNPAWKFTHDDKKWWLVGADHFSWLPTSAETPYTFFNVWRPFTFYAAAWLTAGSVWVGFSRRRSLQLLLYVLAANVLVLAAVGVAHKLDGTSKILWLREFRGATGFSSFVYHNHGAAYVALLALVLCAIGAFFQVEARRRMARSSPAMVWLIAAGAVGIALFYSGSRAGVGLYVLTFLAALGGLAVIKKTEGSAPGAPRVVSFLLGAMVVGCLGFIVAKSDFSELTSKFERLLKEGDKEESYGQRILARDRAVVMLKDNWLLGTGAGSFRFLFPAYISDNPALYEGGKAFWEHAHIDWLQIPIELGLTGVLLIAGALGWCVWRWVKGGGWRHPVGVMIFLGCTQTLLHALIDFPFQNPAILITWWALVVIALRWLELDSPMRAVEQGFKWEAPKRPEHLGPLKIAAKR